jgi:hypothetical protein
MLHQSSMQRHAAPARWGSKQQQMLRRATVANAVAVEGKRSSKKQLNFPFTRIQVGLPPPSCLQLSDQLALVCGAMPACTLSS